MKALLLTLILLSGLSVKSQNYPVFGPEIEVTINGLTFEAMEPFLSPDGNQLFFNNLNDGVETRLYYANKVNDSTFTFAGELGGTNLPTPPHLDAVADMDSLNNFYWTSDRDYFTELKTLFHGSYSSGTVSNIGLVHGDFNKNILGWLVMDHGISIDGQHLYFNNARFDNVNCIGACETEIGIAEKINDSTFNVIPNSTAIMQTINDPNYIYYAPCISSNNLEFYYTRYLNDSITVNTSFDICVAVRTLPTDNFSAPIVLFSEQFNDLIEAPTLTTDMQIVYYHRKVGNSHKIVMRRRDNSANIEDLDNDNFAFTLYPNPTSGDLNIEPKSDFLDIKVSVIDVLGDKVMTVLNQTVINIETLASGTYFLEVEIDGISSTRKIIKN